VSFIFPFPPLLLFLLLFLFLLLCCFRSRWNKTRTHDLTERHKRHCTGTPAAVHAPWYFAGGNQAATLGSSVHSVPGFEDARHDVLLAMMAWVENGTAPDSIVATTWNNDTTREAVSRQRPLCMFPRRALYDGVGDVDDAESWVCR